MKWFQMFTEAKIIELMNAELKAVKENTPEIFTQKMTEIAEDYGLDLFYKSQLHLFFKTIDGRILIGWHDDHSASWTIEEEEFSQGIDIMWLFGENLISNEDLVNIFKLIVGIDQLTEKQQKSIDRILEYIALNREKTYTKADYQKMYHNIIKKNFSPRIKNLTQKAKLKDFLLDTGFMEA